MPVEFGDNSIKQDLDVSVDNNNILQDSLAFCIFYSVTFPDQHIMIIE